MSIRKNISVFIAAILAAGTLFVVSQNVSLSIPKSLGYQSATISGFGFAAGRFSANSYITVDLHDQSQINVPVDASFSAPEIGQKVCIHSSTQWFSTSLIHRFATLRKCVT